MLNLLTKTVIPCDTQPLKVIFFGTIWPEPSASAAGVRTMSLLKITREMGCDVHFCAPARIHMAPIAVFDTLGVKAHGLGAINSAEVDDCVQEIQPDLVIFDRFITEEMFGWRVRNVCPEAAHVIDTQDLHFLRHARQHVVEEQLVYSDSNLWDPASAPQSIAPSPSTTPGTNGSWSSPPSHLLSSTPSPPSRHNNPYKSSTSSDSMVAHASSAACLITDVEYYRQSLSKYGPMLDQDTDQLRDIVTASKRVNVLQVAKRYPVVHANMMRELAAIHRSDLTLVVSHFEKDLLIRHLGVSPDKIEVAPFFYENIPHTTWKQFKNKVGFSMIGHFKHPPNRDGVHWMKHEIWPRIKRSIPSATIDIFGAHPEKSDMALTDSSTGFRVVGTLKAEELTSRLQRARVNLAPLRYGAGIKGKIAENWFSGTPCVTTSIGAESMTSYLRQSDGTMSQSFGGDIADTAEEFARAAVSLYIDATRWHRARAAGYEILTHNFNMISNGPLIQDALWRVVEDREKLRDGNLTGAILWSAGYRYNEMFGRFVQMKTLASQQQASKFVAETKSAAVTDSSQTSAPNPAEIYAKEKEDQEVNKARGLEHDNQPKEHPSRETFSPRSTLSAPSSSAQSANHQQQPSTRSEVDDKNRQFVFGVLAAEQERLSNARNTKIRKSSKPDLADIDESAFVSFKKTLTK